MRTSSATCTRRTRPRCRTSSTCRTYLAHISPTSRPHLAHISPVQVPYVEYLPPHEQVFTCKVGYSGRNVSQARHFVDDGKRRYISRVYLACISPHLAVSPLYLPGAGAAMVLASLAALSQQLPPEAPPEEVDHPAAEGPAEVESALLHMATLSLPIPPYISLYLPISPRWSRRCCTWPRSRGSWRARCPPA